MKWSTAVEFYDKLMPGLNLVACCLTSYRFFNLNLFSPIILNFFFLCKKNLKSHRNFFIGTETLNKCFVLVGALSRRGMTGLWQREARRVPSIKMLTFFTPHLVFSSSSPTAPTYLPPPLYQISIHYPFSPLPSPTLINPFHHPLVDPPRHP